MTIICFSVYGANIKTIIRVHKFVNIILINELLFPVAERNVEKGTVPNFTLLQGTDEQEEEAQQYQQQVDDLALEVLLVEEQGTAQE